MRSGPIIGALAVTESGGGHRSIISRPFARRQKRLSSIKRTQILIGNAPVANLFLILARQFADRGPLGFTVFLVPSDSGGLAVTAAAATIGLPRVADGDVVSE